MSNKMKISKKERKSTKQIEREYNAKINIGVFEAIKIILRDRKEISSAVEVNIGGLKVRISDKAKFTELIDNEILELEKYMNNEKSTYDR